MIEPILQLIQQSQTFLVASHENPDGDAIGSTLALTNMLREMGKDVVAYNHDRAPLEYAFLPGYASVVNQPVNAHVFDAAFVLDAGELKRAGSWIKEHCRKLIETCGPGGGYILAAGCIPDHPKLECVRAMMAAAKEFGVYRK